MGQAVSCHLSALQRAPPAAEEKQFWLQGLAVQEPGP